MPGSKANAGGQGALATHAGSPFFRAELAAILGNAGSAGRLVDVGCGNGALAAMAARMGFQVLGVDSVRVTLTGARHLSPFVPLVQAQVEQLPLRSGSADVLTAQHIIEHLGDAEAAVREWRRVLRPGGRLVILTPNARYPDLSLFNDPTHVRLFGRRDLMALVRRGGFEVLGAKTLFPFLRGHIVFGLRFQRLFARLPPWASTGRSLLCVARKPMEPRPHA